MCSAGTLLPLWCLGGETRSLSVFIMARTSASIHAVSYGFVAFSGEMRGVWPCAGSWAESSVVNGRVYWEVCA